ncbi:MAG TPA: class I SAM-dependent methyltransferase [Patescibacteria group bacterium]|nr:class I SAM-dependent methyltransferase [Patescibacteria group bacterium]
MKDKWLTWLLEKRSGGDAEQKRKTYEGLSPIRNKVIEHADIQAGDTVLDIGTGDGFIAFGVLEKHPDIDKMIFSDISDDTLEFCREATRSLKTEIPVEFLKTSAEKILLKDDTVDVLTARSVYIYVKDREKAFKEAHRVLKPGGRFSIFEPINLFSVQRRGGDYFGMDLSPIQEIADKFLKVLGYPHDTSNDPMLNFDERDLLDLAQEAGFTHIKLVYEARVSSKAKYMPWELLYNAPPNPNALSLKEAFEKSLTQEEHERAVAYMKNYMEKNDAKGGQAIAYLLAIK